MEVWGFCREDYKTLKSFLLQHAILVEFVILTKFAFSSIHFSQHVSFKSFLPKLRKQFAAAFNPGRKWRRLEKPLHCLLRASVLLLFYYYHCIVIMAAQTSGCPEFKVKALAGRQTVTMQPQHRLKFVVAITQQFAHKKGS